MYWPKDIGNLQVTGSSFESVKSVSCLWSELKIAYRIWTRNSSPDRLILILDKVLWNAMSGSPFLWCRCFVFSIIFARYFPIRVLHSTLNLLDVFYSAVCIFVILLSIFCLLCNRLFAFGVLGYLFNFFGTLSLWYFATEVFCDYDAL